MRIPPPSTGRLSYGPGAVVSGNYRYTSDLLLLVQAPQSPVYLSEPLRTVNTPLRADAWALALHPHPDHAFVSYLVEGIRHGFHVGLGGTVSLRSAKRNMGSAVQNAEVVSEYLAKERLAGRVLGPVARVVRDSVHLNRFGVIPKPHQPGKWHLIVDLSHPKGASVNDGVSRELCSLTYASVDDAAKLVLEAGHGAILAKLDVQSAYRNVPVHPDDRALLGMEWNGEVFVDAALPFGLRSAPKKFNALADGLEWILMQQGACQVLHYLDDFLFVGAPRRSDCADAVRLAQEVCQSLGVPLAVEKMEGPSCTLTFLGICLDTVTMELRLPADKLTRLVSVVRQWRSRKSCLKRELLSLIGQLQHACRVVKPGRSFLRRMIDLTSTTAELHHHIRLSAGFRSDLEWWHMFLAEWNGVQMMSSLCRGPPGAIVTSDASGWGCGAFSSTGKWFQCSWPSTWASVHITVKELVPVVIACALWGEELRGRTVEYRTDNAAVVAIVNKGKSKMPLAMHLVRSLFFFMARSDLALYVVHLPGVQNTAADALSRNDASAFLCQVPMACKEAVRVPQELQELLIANQPDWTSSTWRSLLDTFLRRV